MPNSGLTKCFPWPKGSLKTFRRTRRAADRSLKCGWAIRSLIVYLHNIQQFCFLNYSNYGMGFHNFAPWEISFPLKKKRSAFRSWAACREPLWVPAPGMRRRWGVPTAPRISVAPYDETGVDQPLNMGKFWCGYNLGLIITTVCI